MKNITKWIILTLLIIPVIISAGEYDDLLFAAGLYGDGNLSLAQQELENYLEEAPESKYLGEARFLLGTIYLETENYSAAQDIFRLLHIQRPETVAFNDIIAGLATACYGKKEYREAIELLDILTRTYTDYHKASEMHYLLGKCYMAVDKPQQAITSLNTALAKDDTPSIRQELISAYIETGNMPAAKEILTASLEKSGGDETTAYALLSYQRQNVILRNYEEILTLGFDSIKPLSSYYEQYSLVVAIAYFETGNYDQSSQWLEGLETPKSRYYKALNLIQNGDIEAAKTILSGVYADADTELKANSLFYLASLESNFNKKLQLLDEFIANNSDNVFIAEAYYQAGFACYNLTNYHEAQNKLQTAMDKGINGDILENAEYLNAEASYQLQNFEDAKQDFGTFKDNYPNSEYRDEVYFKLALSCFYLKQYDEAEESFKIITFNFQESDKLGMSNFYLGEISLLGEDNSKARQYFTTALNQTVDKEMTWLRIARSWFHDGELNKAAGALENVREGSEYYIDRLLLAGDIHFGKKEYAQAIASYDKVIEQETDQTKKEDIIARKAWTYYQKGDYEQASAIYNQLSIRTDNPASYTFQSATALFSAQQYSQALVQYQTFVKNFPSSPDLIMAEVGIADCFYNLQQFDNARLQYRKLLTLVTNEEMYGSVLDGWKWSTEQAGNDFLAELNNYLTDEIPYNFYFLVSAYKAKHQYAIGHYEDCITTVDELKTRYSYPMKDLEYMRARCLKKLKRWEDADDFYSRIFMVYKDPDLQYEWAEVTLEMGNINTTIYKLQYAAENRKKPEYILQLLELELDNERAEFAIDYEKLQGELSGNDLEKAIALKVKWLLLKKDFEPTANLITRLQDSENREIQAKGQFLKGLSLFEQGNYDAAIPELLRVRHLFPYLPEIRQEAEITAFYAYLKAGKKKEAENLLDNIKTELDIDEIAAMEKLLSGE